MNRARVVNIRERVLFFALAFLVSCLLFLVSFGSARAANTDDCAIKCVVNNVPQPLKVLPGTCELANGGEQTCQDLCVKTCGQASCAGGQCYSRVGKACVDGNNQKDVAGAAGVVQKQLQLDPNAATPNPSSWTCQSLADLKDPKAQNLVSSFCFNPDFCGANLSCCIPGTRDAIMQKLIPVSSCANTVPNKQTVVDLQTETGSDPSTWSCQSMDEVRVDKCLTGAQCPQGSYCCVPGAGPAAGKAVAKAALPDDTGSSGFWIPKDVVSCFKKGSCGLDDIVRTAAAFANFLFGLSGAVALMILVYGGFRYVWAGTPMGGEEDIKKARTAIVGAAIGLAIIFSAHAAVRFVVNAITSPQTVGSCEDVKKGYICKAIQSPDTPQSLGCEQKSAGLCASDFFCCPVEPPLNPKKK